MVSDDGVYARRPLLSAPELRVAGRLDEIFERQGFRVFKQAKLSAAIDPLPTGLSRAQWDYATRATFDFLVCDAATRPQFAIELDDLSHVRAEVQRRDRLKEQVCEAAGFELLRIESAYVDPGPRGRNLVEYLVDARAMFDAFDAAQEAGSVPYDEAYDYRNFIGIHPEGGIDFVNDLGGAARREAMLAHRRGETDTAVIHGIHFSWNSGTAEGWAWLQARGERFIFSRASVRSYQFQCGLAPGELAEDIAAADVGRQLEEFLRGEAVLVSATRIAQQLEAVREHHEELQDARVLDHLNFGPC